MQKTDEKNLVRFALILDCFMVGTLSGSFFFGTRNRNHPQRAKVPLYKCVVSLSETVRLGFEPDSTSLKLVEQVDSGEYKRKKEPSKVALFSLAPATGIEPVTNP